MNKRLVSLGGVAAALILFVAFNMVARAALRPARLDLTENSLYTLSKGSRNIARNLKEPVTLTLYYSDKQAASLSPQYQSYGQRVKEVLREYASISGGKITLNIVNPEPFSDIEDRAVQAGLAGVPAGRGGGAAEERFYFGLVGTSSTDRSETIPFFRPDREEFLEYELTRMIYLLSDPPRKTVGVMAWLPLDGGGPNPMTRQPPQPWQIYTQLKDLFELKKVANDASEIPADIQVLLVVHPKNVPEKTQYAIDQFVVKGGRAVIFVDPLCEVDVPPGINPMQAMQLPKNSSLPRLFGVWGIELQEGVIAADRDAAIRVPAGSQTRPETIEHVLFLRLTRKDNNVDKSDPITGQLDTLNYILGGVLQKKPDATTEVTPLLRTGTDSMTVPSASVQFTEPKKLLADFAPGGKDLTLAARVTGKVKSAFAGPPPAAPDPNSPSPEAPPPAPTAPHVAESADSINVVVVADCDFLSNRVWVDDRFREAGFISKFADNADFVVAALDNLTGSSDLISVRARGGFARPFDRVKQIQRDAEQRYLTEERDLQEKLRTTEQKINELQRQRPDKSAGGIVLLTPAQEAEIEKFRAEQVETRKKLRDVQHQLRKDIEGLGLSLKFLNIGLVPLLVGLTAVGLSAWRVRRRRQDRTAPKALS